MARRALLSSRPVSGTIYLAPHTSCARRGIAETGKTHVGRGWSALMHRRQVHQLELLPKTIQVWSNLFAVEQRCSFRLCFSNCRKRA
jgi:hypothetical protein